MEETQKCNQCDIEKELSEFYKAKNNKLGVSKKCKKCADKINRNFAKNNRDKGAESSKKYYEKNKPDIIKKQIEYNKKNRDAHLLAKKKHRENNKEKISIERKKYYELNKEKEIEKAVLYLKERYRTDENFRITEILRGRIKKIFKIKNINKAFKSADFIGCSIRDFKQHLESQFTDGMTWSNRGLKGWHIDHIKPCASFDLTDPEQQKQCFHYTNLQPLWAEDNLKKGSLYNGVRYNYG